MKIAIHQPDYIPWIGLFYKMSKCDIFVYLDDAQFSNEAAHNFNTIKTANGDFKLKIPVKCNFGDKINEVVTRDELGWKEKQLKTIEQSYKKAKYFNDIFPKFKEILMKKYDNISNMNIALNTFFSEGFNIKPRIYRSSEMNINSVREKRIIDICITLNGDEYISGNGAKVYQNEKNFEDNNLKLTYIDYRPITYNQLWGDFSKCLSILDYVFNEGWNWNLIISKVLSLNNGKEN